MNSDRKMRIIQTRDFKNAVKKLHKNQKKDLDAAVNKISENPQIGEQKKGDLIGVRVYKFRMVEQLTLLSYSFDNNIITLTFISLGSHENFYPDLKN